MLDIRVQPDDFNVQQEYDALCRDNAEDGAVVFFVGRVRDFNEGDTVTAMFLEHYPGMTEKTLEDISYQARERWPLNRIRIVHRIGEMKPADQIVFVAVTSPHRGAAFAGAQFIMDFLKTRAPFWKKERTTDGDRWVEAKASDSKQEQRW